MGRRLITILTVLTLIALGACSNNMLELIQEKIAEDGASTGSVYVSTFGSTANTGLSPASPKLTILEGLNCASSLGLKEVNVAAGIYNIADGIVMVNGISLYGGYSADYSSHDPGVYTTTINDSRIVAETIYTIKFNSDISSETYLDGFTVKGGAATGDYQSFIIHISSSDIIISNNRLIGGNDGYDVFGMAINDSSPKIKNNYIEITKGYSNNRGIYISGAFSSPIIRNNVIISKGANFNSSIDIRSTEGSAEIQNNTFYAGASPNSTCYDYVIRVRNSNTPRIENNIFYMLDNSSGTRWGVVEYNDTANVTHLLNNAFFNCSTALFHNESGENLTDINNVNDYTKTTQNGAGTSQGNVNMEPLFVTPGSDFHLLNSTPINIRGGGRNISDSYTDDIEGIKRTIGTPYGATNTGAAGWSIGAYEQDN